MPKAGRYREGVPCWVVLTTPDAPRARRFYGELFGWGFVPTGPGEAVATRFGAQVAAITVEPATPSAVWTVHFACADLRRTAALVRASGGRIAREPYELPDQGRAALAVDPLGAVFGLWRGGTIDGAGLVNEPGALTWNEHVSPDPDAARAFYRRVFGYTYDRPRAGHTLARVAGLPACGIGPAGAPGASGRGDAAGPGGTGGPGCAGASWRTHFATADTDRAAARLPALGGAVLAGPEPTSFGRSALVRDDAGAEFVLVAVPPTVSVQAA
ncbi:VOC family protein [Kitasatospora sp. SUK 42]|uniref:VOC family protein n=1 Tax=Kitasatospora sp. SUK 42 TaxID=1588882 RepID=UPI001C31D113|nr:VOC family protein [Kitasatospora sp. SUK 42]MBV2155896.1 VOC family protein [Kitasatospora sp. SUK 42]